MGFFKDGMELVVEGYESFHQKLTQAQKDADDTTAKLDKLGTQLNAAERRLAIATPGTKAYDSAAVSVQNLTDKQASLAQELTGAATAGAIFGSVIGGIVVGAVTLGVHAIGDMINALVELVGKGINAAIDGMKELTSITVDYLVEGTGMAGRWRELEFGAQAVGLEMGYTTQQIKDSIQAVADVNIRYDEAARSILLMAQNEIQLSKATELATIAQGVGVTRAMDSSEAFRMMTMAIASGNTHRLRTLGIMVQMTKAETEYAASLGKSREAMSSAERVQARLNAVLEWGANLGAVYAAAMASPTKVLRSITERLLPTIQAALGEPFLNGLGYVVSAFYDLATAMVAAMREGTPLYYLLVDIGAAFAMMAEPVADVINWITKWFTGLDTSITTTLEGTVSSALSWGFNISAALAEGLIEGASYIVDAITAIANLIASWLAPGSPPRALPELTWWGTQAMVEYLHGFELADFSVLENIQGVIERILTPEAFRALSADLIEAISTGTVDDSMFDQIAAATGRFGNEVADLARKEFALADAIKQVEEAQLAFDAAVLAVEDAQSAVRGLTDEYNMLLKAGADPALLEAKLAEVNAAEDGLAQREQEAVVADQNLDAANERKDAIEDERDLQRALVQQLLALAESTNTAAESMRKALKKAAGGAGELGAELEAGIAPVMGRIFDKMQKDIEKRKEELKKRLGEMFDTAFGPLEGKARDLATKIDNILMEMFGFELFGEIEPEFKIMPGLGMMEEVGPLEQVMDRLANAATQTFTTIKDAINNDVVPALKEFATNVGLVWDAFEGAEKVDKIFDNVQRIVSALTGVDFEGGEGITEADWTALGQTLDYAGDKVVDFTTDLAELAEIIGWFEEHDFNLADVFAWNEEVGMPIDWEAIGEWNADNAIQTEDIVPDVGEVKSAWDRIRAILMTPTRGLDVAVTAGSLTTALNILHGNVERIFGSIGLDLDAFVARWQKSIDDAAQIVSTYWTRIKSDVINGYNELVLSLQGLDERMSEPFHKFGANVTAWWDGTFVPWVTGAWTQLKTSLQVALDSVSSAMVGVWTSTKDSAIVVWTDISTWAIQAWADLKIALVEPVQDVKDTFTSAWTDTLTAIQGMWQSFKDAGIAVVNGVIEGINETAASLIESITGAVEDTIAAVKSTLGISSPSSVFMEIGGNIIEGLIQGALNILGGIGTKIAEGIAALFGEESVLKLVETAFADLRAPIEEFATWFGETSVELQGDVTDLADAVTLDLLAASIKFVNYVRSTFNPTLDTLSTKLKTAKTNTDNLGTAISALKDKASAAYGPVRSLKDIVNDLGDELYGTASDAWSLHGALSEIADSDGVLVRLGRRMDDFRNGPLREVRNSFGSLLSTLLAIIAALRLMGNTLGGGGGSSSMVAESPNTITDVPMQRRIFMPQSIQPQMIFDQAALAQAQPAQVSIGPNYFTSTVNAERVVQTWKRQMARELAIS